jgi:hypothetical protein
MATEIEAAAIRDRLLKKLAARQPDVERLDRYYRGEHDHAVGHRRRPVPSSIG